MNEKYPQALEDLMELLRGLPGVGRRSAERMAMHFFSWDDSRLGLLSDVLADLKKQRDDLRSQIENIDKAIDELVCVRYPNLANYLADINAQAEERMLLLTGKMAQREGLTEQLKAQDQMLWVHRMNRLRSQAEELVLAELIYC